MQLVKDAERTCYDDYIDVQRRGAVRIDKTIDAIELYYVPGWTDGLPVVPPNPLAALAPEAVIQRADAVVEQSIEQLMTTH